MKPLSLLVFVSLMIVTVTCKAQYTLIGMERQDLKNFMVYKNHELLESSVSKDNAPYDMYNLIPSELKGAYYFKHDTCYAYKEIIGKFLLTETIKDLNSRFVKVEGFHWITKDATINIYLNIPEEGKEFVVDYFKI